MVKKVALRALFCIVFLSLTQSLCLTLHAQQAPAATDGTEALFSDHDAVGDAFDDFCDAIPQELADLLPQELFSKDPQELSNAVATLSSPRSVLSTLGELLGVSLQKNLAFLATLLGILILSSLTESLCALNKEGDCVNAFRFLSSAMLCVVVLKNSLDAIPRIAAYFDGFCTLTGAAVPLMGVLYALGGNCRAAIANQAVMGVFLTVAQHVCAKYTLPVAGASLLLALPDALGEAAGLSSLSRLIKRSFSSGLGFLVAILAFLLGVQSLLAAGSDSLALRTMRFATSSFLPIVGGSLSGTIGVLAGSVGFLRTVVGSFGIWALFLLFLPTLISCLFTRTVYLVSASLAESLGAKSAAKLLSELASVWGMLLAVVATLFAMAIFSLALFARTVVAGG